MEWKRKLPSISKFWGGPKVKSNQGKRIPAEENSKEEPSDALKKQIEQMEAYYYSNGEISDTADVSSLSLQGDADSLNLLSESSIPKIEFEESFTSNHSSFSNQSDHQFDSLESNSGSNPQLDQALDAHIKKVNFAETEETLYVPQKERQRSKSLQPGLNPEDTYHANAEGYLTAKAIQQPKTSSTLKIQIVDPSQNYLSASDLESEERDALSELNTSAFPSTLFNSVSIDSSSQESQSASVESIESHESFTSALNGGVARRGSLNEDNTMKMFPKASKPMSNLGKKLFGNSTNAGIPSPSPGLSLLAISSKTPTASKLEEPQSPSKIAMKRVALSAHEIHPPAIMKRYTLDDFYAIRRVGKGGFAKVFLVRLKKSSRKYFALKCIKKSDIIRLKQEKQIMNEKNILSMFKHEFIVDLYSTFQTRSHLYMLMEFVPGGDLYSLMKKTKGFPEEQAKFYISEVVIALDFLHTMNIIYRDLKPENVLLDATGHIKLTDFGFARILHGKTRSFCGTPDYIAWEIVMNKDYDHTVDWWSLGVLIFELVAGKTPFRAKTAEEIYQNIQDMNIQWLPTMETTCMDLIQRLLVSDPDKRLGHRIGAPEIKMHAWFHSINWKKTSQRQTIPPAVPPISTPDVIEKEQRSSGLSSTEFQEYLDQAQLDAIDSVVDPFKDF